jgi:hypothetical protein
MRARAQKPIYESPCSKQQREEDIGEPKKEGDETRCEGEDKGVDEPGPEDGLSHGATQRWYPSDTAPSSTTSFHDAFPGVDPTRFSCGERGRSV